MAYLLLEDGGKIQFEAFIEGDPVDETEFFGDVEFLGPVDGESVGLDGFLLLEAEIINPGGGGGGGGSGDGGGGSGNGTSTSSNNSWAYWEDRFGKRHRIPQKPLPRPKPRKPIVIDLIGESPPRFELPPVQAYDPLPPALVDILNRMAFARDPRDTAREDAERAHLERLKKQDEAWLASLNNQPIEAPPQLQPIRIVRTVVRSQNGMIDKLEDKMISRDKKH